MNVVEKGLRVVGTPFRLLWRHKGKILVAALVFGTFGAYKNYTQQQEERLDKVPPTPSAQKDYVNGINQRVVKSCRNGAISAIMKSSMETQLGRKLPEGTRTNIDTLRHTPKGWVDKTGIQSPNDGNTLVGNGRLNDGKASVPFQKGALDEVPLGAKEEANKSTVSKTLAHNGSRVVYKGKSSAQVNRTVPAQKVVVQKQETSGHMPSPKVSGSRRGNPAYNQSGPKGSTR